MESSFKRDFDECVEKLDEVYAHSKVIARDFFPEKEKKILELLKLACDDYKLTWQIVFHYERDAKSDIKSMLTSSDFVEKFVDALKDIHKNAYKKVYGFYVKSKYKKLKNSDKEIDEMYSGKIIYRALRINHEKTRYMSLEKLLGEISSLQNEINNHPFRTECSNAIDSFLKIVAVKVNNIEDISTYRFKYISQSRLDKLIADGKLTKNYKPIDVTACELKSMSARLNNFMSSWRNDLEHDSSDFDTVFDSFDTSHKFTLLYSIITYPCNESFEMYKYVCNKFFELLEQHPYLIDYDGILDHPIVCELAHQTHYYFFAPHIKENLNMIKKRNIFFRELFMRQSELLIHIDKYGTTGFTKLVS